MPDEKLKICFLFVGGGKEELSNFDDELQNSFTSSSNTSDGMQNNNIDNSVKLKVVLYDQNYFYSPEILLDIMLFIIIPLILIIPQFNGCHYDVQYSAL